MGGPYETLSNSKASDHDDLHIIRHSHHQPYPKFSSPWFDLRVFYVRVSNFQVDESATEFLTLNHIPLSPDTLLEVNGIKSSNYAEGVSSLLRRDRIDKKSEEATYVSTDSIRLSGSVKFEVVDKEDKILSGVLELENRNGFVGESKSHAKRWNMTCESIITAGSGFLKGKHAFGPELLCPTIEVYVAGSFLGNPIILTKTLQLSFRKKHDRKGMLNSIPEDDDTTGRTKDPAHGYDLQVAEYRNFGEENEEDYNSLNWGDYVEEGEDGELLSWFNAGVRVGVGIGLGIFLGVGIGAGLLVRSYQATTRNFKRRFI